MKEKSYQVLNMNIVEPLLTENNMQGSLNHDVYDEPNKPLNPPLERRRSSMSLLMANEEIQQRNIRLFDYINAKEEKRPVYPKNVVTTYRYTLITFLPKSLLEQFRRLANIYFLVLGIIAIVGAYTNYFETSVAPEGILTPVMIVIAISMIKEGIEDIKRHQSDMKVNSKPSKMITPDGSVTIVQRQQLQVGSLVLFHRDEELPADVVVLQCGGIQGPLAYVETAAIDGETNLKIRLPALSQKAESGSDSRPVSKSSINSQLDPLSPPINNNTDENALLTIRKDHSFVFGVDELRKRLRLEAEPPTEFIYRFNGCLYLSKDNSGHESEPMPLTDKNLLLRGSVLRATEWCIGVVVYTGRDTKLSLNSKTPPSKLSSVDRIVNRTLLVAISVMIFVCIISMAFTITWGDNNANANYLCLSTNDLSSVYESGGGCTSGNTSSGLTIFTFATLYNNFVCISMYVSLEMVYLLQAFFLNQDLTIYDSETDTRAECHSSGLCADLGQIQYILSDKTGTLTKNVMKLRRCAVIGRVFGPPIDIRNQPIENSSSTIRVSEGHTREEWEPLTNMLPKVPESSFHGSVRPDLSHHEVIEDFLRVMALCNNVMLMPDEQGQLDITDIKSLEASIQAESADEVALVLAAAQYASIYLTARSNYNAVVAGFNTDIENSLSNTESWDILAVNEFESDRKRMSILLRTSNRHVLLCKGADSSMFPYCKQSSHTSFIMEQTEKFASNGLRTLIAAKKELTHAEAMEWLATYKAAKSSVAFRDEKLSSCAHTIEQDMSILGCIGIEDELQDGVPEAIRQLQETGVNVWMITGDKAETAIAIGKMCNLLNEGSKVEKFVGLSVETIRQRLTALEKLLFDVPVFESTNRTIAKELSNITVTTTASPMTSVDLEAHNRPDLIEREESIASNHSVSPLAMFFNTNIPTKPSAKRENMSLIIDGSTLEKIWKSPDLKLKFSIVITDIPIVIACRVSPLQKASLVRMIKTSPLHPVTLGIGDGANDVGMINEARVGVGISGREGRHAANAADFAISQFRFLVPLLLEHGRFNYIRCSKLVLYSFYKNLLLVSFLFYYCIYSGFSGTIPLTSLVFTGYNFYLGLPIIAIGGFDFDIPKSFVYTYPALAYATGRQGELLNYWNMLRWCLWGFFVGFMIYILCIRMVGGPIFITSKYNNGNTANLDITGIGLNYSQSTGWAGGIYVEGFAMYTVIVVSMQVKVIAMTQSRTIIFWASIAISMIGYIMFAYLYGVVSTTQWYDTVPITFGMSMFWLGLISIPSIIGVFDYCADEVSKMINPSSMDKIRVLYENEKRYGVKADPK